MPTTIASTPAIDSGKYGDAFVASSAMTASLQQVLVDLVALTLASKQAHWTIVGRNFRDLHLQLDGIADDAREASDTIAERMRALQAIPDGRLETVLSTTSLPEFPLGELDVTAVVDLITHLLRRTAATLRAVHDDVDAEDPSTADLLHGIIGSLEKSAWMVSAENAGR